MVNMRVIKAKNAIMTLVIIAFLIMLIIKIFLFGKDKIKETKNNGYVENGKIPVYRFEVTTNENKKIGI